jgi:hypothetical protein
MLGMNGVTAHKNHENTKHQKTTLKQIPIAEIQNSKQNYS